MNTKTLLKSILFIQLLLLALVVLESSGLVIPLLRQITGFLYLTFVPGLLIIRCIRLNNPSITKMFLFSAGISISFIMFFGAFVNAILPLFGITKPLSTIPLTLSFAVPVLITSIVLYIKEKNNSEQRFSTIFLNFLRLFSADRLFLLFLPVLTILGTILINYVDNQSIMVLVLFFIAIAALLVILGRFIKPESYPLAVFCISLSICLHVSLVSSYPIGWNFDTEYLFASLTAEAGYWDSTLTRVAVNSLLSIVIIGPAYSGILDIEVAWVFKIVYPFLQALIPLIVFTICREQLSVRKSFLASFFVLSMPFYFYSLPLFRRDLTVIFFILMLLLSVTDKELSSFNKMVFIILFTISMPVSHYGTTYIFLFLVVTGWIVYRILPSFQKTMARLLHNNTAGETLPNDTAFVSLLRFGPVFFLFLFMIIWFMYISGGTNFSGMIYRAQETVIDLQYFFAPEARPQLISHALGVGLQPAVNALNSILRIINYILEAFIVIGTLSILVRPELFNLQREYRAILLAAALVFVMGLLLPYTGFKMGLGRLNSFILPMIAPFVAIGAEAAWRMVHRLLTIAGKLRKHTPAIMNSISLFFSSVKNAEVYLGLIIFIPYFLFNTGFVHEIARNFMESTGPTGATKSPILNAWDFDNYYFYRDEDVSGAKWTIKAGTDDTVITGDKYTMILFSYWITSKNFGFTKTEMGLKGMGTGIPETALIYLRTWNTQKQEYWLEIGKWEEKDIKLEDMPEFSEIINRSNRIYNNGGAQVLERR